MTTEEFEQFLSDNDITDPAAVVRFLGGAHRFSGDVIRYLARSGKDDARAHLSEAQADESEATAVGYDELGAELGE